MKIVFTGGHHTSSLVIAKALQSRGHEIFWFGHRQTMWQEPSISLEYEEVTEAGIEFLDLKAGKLYRELHPLKLLRIPAGFLRAFILLLRVKPDLIVSFGGYLALPVVICGWLLKIPSVTHEQTRVYGLTNKLIIPFVKKIFLTWETSKRYFPEEKTLVTGLPLRKEILEVERKAQKPRPIIYITGGKQGSHVINQAVAKILPELLKEYSLYHQSGKIIKTGDFAFLQKKKNALNLKLQDHYYLKPFFNSREVAKIFSVADLVISRSGAHIVYELAFLGIPAIFVPLPWAYQNEQEKNANLFKINKAGLVLKDEELTPSALVRAVNLILSKKSYQRQAQKLRERVKIDAKEKILAQIEAILDEKKKG